jgi:epoxyqueuosine reductase
MSELTGKIKKIAADIGFDKIGITAAKQPEKSKFLEAWLKNNYDGTMEWMGLRKNQRLNIEEFFPGAKSIICIAQNYYSPFGHLHERDRGKISRYAWGEDYHRIMKKKLKLLLQQIQQIDSTLHGRLCVDTAPIMEKLWAEQAGIGWQGKNTNLISRDYGSWIFLGEIVVDKELSYDTPIEDYCGSCQACMEACPTTALVEPYVLDASKCISYLTIEYREDAIAEHFGSKLNQWIFGCDICQDVCPWNKFKQITNERHFFPKQWNVDPDLNEWVMMDEIDFRKKFKKSPLLRPGWINFIRNIKAALKKD